MGCDIHVFCEYRKDSNSPWINCDSFRINPNILTQDDWDNFKPNEMYDYDPKMWHDSIYTDRCYTLFGLLAGVRSMAVPIKEPCGVPDDMHWLTKKYIDMAKNFGHSYTYYYASELIDAYDKMKHKWKKAKKKADHIETEDYDKYAMDSEGYVIGCNKHRHLKGLIGSMKHLMSEYLYCWDSEDYYEQGRNFRLIMFFDS